MHICLGIRSQAQERLLVRCSRSLAVVALEEDTAARKQLASRKACELEPLEVLAGTAPKLVGLKHVWRSEHPRLGAQQGEAILVVIRLALSSAL